MSFTGIEEVINQVGTMILKTDGSIVASNGELADNQAVASTIFNMLQDAAKILANSGKSSPLERILVTFDSYRYAVTLDEAQIYVVKCQA